MKTQSLFAVILVSMTLLFVSCKDESATVKPDKVKESIKTEEPFRKYVVKSEETGFDIWIEHPLTTVELLNQSWDFGHIDDGDKLEHIFKIKNVGEKDLYISDVRVICGCTVPAWPKEAIAPGEICEILVKYDSTGRGLEGGGGQMKNVAVVANTDPPETMLTVKGIIFSGRKK